MSDIGHGFRAVASRSNDREVVAGRFEGSFSFVVRNKSRIVVERQVSFSPQAIQNGQQSGMFLVNALADKFDDGDMVAGLTASTKAQRENINIWTIYARDAGRGGAVRSPLSNAQSNLTRLSEETGAQSYYLGFGEPVNLKPYLDEIQMHLNQPVSPDV
jgi:hypothetical protein